MGQNLDQPRIQQVWGKKLRNKLDFMKGRDGDHLLIPFECDRCIFLKLKHTLPDASKPSDQLLLATIRRMNLDAFWSRESSTVKSNLNRVKRMLDSSNSLGLNGPFKVQPPFPLYDHCGYEVALIILLRSRHPGKHHNSYTQFDTIRSYRASYSNFIRSTTTNTSITRSLGDSNGNYQRFAEDECASLFFKRFIDGLRSRMGQVVKPNLALSTPLLLRLIDGVERKLVMAESPYEKHLFMSTLAYIIISYTLSLRGSEGFMIDLQGLRKQKDKSPNYCIIALLGRLKGEKHDLTHLIPCVNKTKSGLNIRSIIARLIELKASANLFIGPAISTMDGKVLTSKAVDDILHDVLTDIFLDSNNLFPPQIDSIEKIRNSYQCFRSFRRSSTTRATEQGVSTLDGDVVSRWKAKEDSKGKRPNLGMRQHYTQLDLLVKPFLRYTKAM